MLKYKADIKTLLFLSATTAIFFVQWNTGFHPLLYIVALYLAITVAVIAHNHNHVPMWKSQTMNLLTDYWITLFYGFPVFAWIPTHNRNHHKFNNKEGDHTITYRVSESNNILTLLSYPAISSYYQQSPIMGYLRDLWSRNRRRFFEAAFQYVALGILIGVTLWLDWRKSLLFIVIPHQVALFSVLIFNYIQHVHADEESEYNHSRNFVSRTTNWMLFNNGLHTAHHQRANIHWSELPAAHARIEHLIDPSLKERGFWPYILRTYVVGIFVPACRTVSMRLRRLGRMQAAS
jgi:fatty acid desaturase